MYLFVFDLEKRREGLGKPMGAVSAFMQRNYLLQPFTGGNLKPWNLTEEAMQTATSAIETWCMYLFAFFFSYYFFST